MTILLVTVTSDEANSEFWDSDSWGIWKSSGVRVRWRMIVMMNYERFIFCAGVCMYVCVDEGWPGAGEPWRGNYRGSAAGWGRWRSIDQRNASAGWQTASVWGRCAGGCPSGRKTCPSCRSAPANTNNKPHQQKNLHRIQFSDTKNWYLWLNYLLINDIMYCMPLSTLSALH